MIQARNRIYEIFSFECHGRPDFQEGDTQIMGKTLILLQYLSRQDNDVLKYKERYLKKIKESEKGSGIEAT